MTSGPPLKHAPAARGAQREAKSLLWWVSLALSPRELEVVKLIAEGLTSEEIGAQLVISKKPVDRHRANVLEKLGMRNRVELTRYPIRRGLVEP
jgi:DNA-binding NarL/FixJ family response regulator